MTLNRAKFRNVSQELNLHLINSKMKLFVAAVQFRCCEFDEFAESRSKSNSPRPLSNNKATLSAVGNVAKVKFDIISQTKPQYAMFMCREILTYYWSWKDFWRFNIYAGGLENLLYSRKNFPESLPVVKGDVW